jgi:putative RecB family exonuclease
MSVSFLSGRAARTETSRPETAPHLSYSQIRTYASCPLAWKLSRTEKPEQTPAALVFGSAFHAAAERFYQARLEGGEPGLPDLLAAYDRAWVERTEGQAIRYPARADNPVALRELAERMLWAFLEHARAHTGEIIAVEEPFEVELAAGLPPLRGRLDLIEITDTPSGKRLQLVDLKTAARRCGAEDIDREQLDLYALAARRTGLLRQFGLPLDLRVDLATKTKVCEIIPLAVPPEPKNEARLIAKARAVWRGMAAGVCYPAPGWRCPDCGYKTACGKWPEGR